MIMLRYMLAAIVLAMFTGCATTPATPETVEVRAYKAGRYGTHAYLIGRDHLAAPHREATRRAYLAFGLWMDAAHASGMESVRLDAEAVALIVADVPDEWRGLAGEILMEVVARVRDRIPADVAGLDSYRIALAVHRGIGDVLRERGIDPDAEVTP
jgi:hypothetical protein